MNIAPYAPNLSLPTVINPPTEGLRRENSQREIITQVGAANHSAAEKGVASDKERARTPAQTNEQVDFSNLRKHAEHASTSISEQKDEHNSEHQGSEQDEARQESKQGHDKQDDAQNNKQNQITDDANKIQEQAAVLAEQKIINQLQSRDQEVRQHELAHASTGGSTTGTPSYSFEVGPDGKKYAVGGEVSVDLSSVSGNPQATITKMQKVHAAALAPANPSAQDTRVAASASRIILQAQSEILAQQAEDSSKTTPSQNSVTSTKTTFNQEQENIKDDFDTFINQTLSAQEEISPSNTARQQEVALRSQRIENFYFNISQGYEKPDNFQFELKV
jgi:hypothetical protein